MTKNRTLKLCILRFAKKSKKADLTKLRSADYHLIVNPFVIGIACVAYTVPLILKTATPGVSAVSPEGAVV